MSPIESFSKWLQLKIYQVEVTFSVYIFTPLEKFIFWSVAFLLFALTFIAVVLYLPRHTLFLANRAWFYINGDSVDVLEVAKEAVQTLAHHTAAAATSSSLTTVATAAGMVKEL
ncbi:hypothetical protein NKR23_g6350 [Pleurostoma richardsiae]|uniref:Uncharacterized protein n=1 Tax=Pleurostoma richardsiae TaxID=41990 RepID=A0AA38VI09_9PEZI|nr:hypothetical protein NKR23_g6350 [Pleurostoma richardsiae]